MTNNYIRGGNMKVSKKFYSSKSDSLFKSVVGCEKGKRILKAVIEDALKIKIDKLEIINNEIEKNNIKEMGKRVDCLVKSGNNIINIEVNSSVSQAIKDRNLRFMMAKHISQYKEGESYYTAKRIVQINLDWGVRYKKIKKEYMLYEKDDRKDIFSDDITIYSFDMEKLKRMCYDEDERCNEYKYITMLAIDDKERLIEYTKGDEIMEEYSNEAIELNNTYTDMLTWEEDDKLIRESEKLYARDEGMKKGIEKGKIETAKKMLEKGTDIIFISEVTGLSLEQIEKI